MDWSCADICDWRGDTVSYCDAFPFRHFTKVMRFSGRIVTVQCLDDNSKVKETLAGVGEGQVLVVDGGGSTKRALLGDLIAVSAVNNKWAGVIINGVVRDSQALSGIEQLGIIALGTNPRKSERKGAGSINQVVEFNGLTFSPGAYVYVDQDGMIVSSDSVMKP